MNKNMQINQYLVSAMKHGLRISLLFSHVATNGPCSHKIVEVVFYVCCLVYFLCGLEIVMLPRLENASKY